MRIQEWLESRDRMVGYKSLSVRQARWVARLYAIVAENVSMPLGKTDIDIPTLQLWQAAYIYAEQERISEISKTPFNTGLLDKGLRQGMSKLIAVYTTSLGTEDIFRTQNTNL